jgi:hypothetical protein
MRTTWIAAVAGLAALFSLPASADHWHHGGPYVSFGYSYGYPWGYRPFYDRFYDPWFYPGVGVGVRIDHTRDRDARTADRGAEQKALKMYVYPAAGQSAEQLSKDRYDCHVWASDQSGYDPTLGAGKKDDAESYTRAFTACMEGRNYVVK